jgi:hypothetical protein
MFLPECARILLQQKWGTHLAARRRRPRYELAIGERRPFALTVETGATFVPGSLASSGAAVAGHCLLGLARIATSDHIEMERSAQIQNTHLNLGRELGSVAAKLRYGVSKHSGLQTSEAEGRVGSPVDRDSEERLQEPERLGGAARIEVARAERRTPTPDRQQHEI